MDRPTSIAVPMLVFSTAILVAQPAPPHGAPRSTPVGSAATDDVRKVTGCLRSGETPNTFLLAVTDDTREDPGKTQTSAAGDNSTSASPRAAGTTGAAVKTTTYQLVPELSSVDLRRFVGQRVEVAGKAGVTSGPTTASKSSEAPPAHHDAAPGDAGAIRSQEQIQPPLHVTSVKPVGGSCR
jgi:hypothetical protein